MPRLSAADLARSSIASADTSGVQFAHDGRVYRAFREADAKPLRRLLASPRLETLFDRGLARFRRAALEVEGHDLVIEVDRVPVVSYPTEWPTRMLQSAGLTILAVASELVEHGLRLKDAHPWNVLFDGTRAVFVDLGSIVDGTDVHWTWLAELRRHILLPLMLHDLSLHRLGDAVMREHRTAGAKGAWDHRLLQVAFPPSLFVRFLAQRTSPAALYQRLTEKLGALDARGTPMAWSNYDQRPVGLDDKTAFSRKQQEVDRFLGSMPPGRVVDLAANRGLYSRHACQHGHDVVAIDIDDRALGELYDGAREDDLPIVPLRIDVLWPTGSHGIGLGYADAFERLSGDAVLALALLHHLAGGQGVRFELFARLIDKFARTAAIVEFVPRDDSHIASWPLASEAWYDIHNLVSALRIYFPSVDVVPSSPDPRQLVILRR